MNFKYFAVAAFLALLILAPSTVFAQEGEVTVVDEVIAQVNDEVITLSQLKREAKERIEALKQNDKVMAEALAAAQRTLGLLAANLVNVLDPEMIVIGGGVTELEPFRDAAGLRVALHGPDVRLGETTSSVLTLVVHELTTNATK